MYQITVNDQHSFKVSPDQIQDLDAIETKNNQFHILKDHTSIKAEIVKGEFNKKQYSIKVNNSIYEVAIQDELDLQIKALGFEIGATKKINEIKAPMPGLILEISVKEGQDVKENDALLILEAMKMENVINSPREGVIKSIKVTQGKTVDKNALLIEFES